MDDYSSQPRLFPPFKNYIRKGRERVVLEKTMSTKIICDSTWFPINQESATKKTIKNIGSCKIVLLWWNRFVSFYRTANTMVAIQRVLQIHGIACSIRNTEERCDLKLLYEIKTTFRFSETFSFDRKMDFFFVPVSIKHRSFTWVSRCSIFASFDFCFLRIELNLYDFLRFSDHFGIFISLPRFCSPLVSFSSRLNKTLVVRS